MISWLIRATFSLVLTVAVVVVITTVPVGRRTLFEHALAIVSSQPARELGEDLVETSKEIGARVDDAMRKRAAADGHAAGAPTP